MVQAVIFDMDGVLIDSEPFWQQAQIEIFSQLGIAMSKADCESCMGMRIDLLVAHWHGRRPWQGLSQAETVGAILDRVIDLIMQKGQTMAGLHAALDLVQRQGLKLGLATSSPMRLVEAVLARLQIADSFDICHSAEFERYGKPHPAVYLTAAEKLGVAARDCLAIEDSFNGLLAAKSAGMQAVIIPDPAFAHDPRLAIADFRLASLHELTHRHLGRERQPAAMPA